MKRTFLGYPFFEDSDHGTVGTDLFYLFFPPTDSSLKIIQAEKHLFDFFKCVAKRLEAKEFRHD